MFRKPKKTAESETKRTSEEYTRITDELAQWAKDSEALSMQDLANDLYITRKQIQVRAKLGLPESTLTLALQAAIYPYYLLYAGDPDDARMCTAFADRIEQASRETKITALIAPAKAEDKRTNNARVLHALSKTFANYPFAEEYLILEYFRRAIATCKTDFTKLLNYALLVTNLDCLESWNAAVEEHFNKTHPLHALLTLPEKPDEHALRKKFADFDAKSMQDDAAVLRVPLPIAPTAQKTASINFMLITFIEDLADKLELERKKKFSAGKLSPTLNTQLTTAIKKLKTLSDEMIEDPTLYDEYIYQQKIQSTIALLYVDIYCNDRIKQTGLFTMKKSDRGEGLTAFSTAIEATSKKHLLLSHLAAKPFLVKLTEIEYPATALSADSKDAKESKKSKSTKGTDLESRIFQAFSTDDTTKQAIVEDRFANAIHIGLDRLANGDHMYLVNCVKMMSKERLDAVGAWNEQVKRYFNPSGKFSSLHTLLLQPADWVGDSTFINERLPKFLKALSKNIDDAQAWIDDAKGQVPKSDMAEKSIQSKLI